MKIPNTMPRLKGLRYPREVIAYAVWAYFRFPTSTADVEDLLAARGIIVSRETVRQWANRFDKYFADCIRRDRPKPRDKWHLDEMVIGICGQRFWLWRAIDANGDVWIFWCSHGVMPKQQGAFPVVWSPNLVSQELS